MDGTTFTTIDNALKRQYLPELESQVEGGVQTWDIFGKDSDKVTSMDAYMKMFTGFPQGVGAAAAGELLPRPSASVYREAKISMKRNYGVIQLDAALRDDKSGIVDALEDEMKNITTMLKKELNFQLAFGDGTGARAQAVSSSDNDGGVPTITFDAGGGAFTDQIVSFLFPQMEISMYGGSTLRGTYIIADGGVDVANSKITLTTGATPATDGVADNDLCYRFGQKDLVMNGIKLLVKDSGTLQTVDPTGSGNAFWKSYKKDMSNKWGTSYADFLDIIQETIDEIEKGSTQADIDLIYAWPLFGRQYVSGLEAKRQIVNTLEFKAGRTGYKYVKDGKELAIMKDKYLTSLVVYFLTSKTLKFKTLRGIHWEEAGGGILKVLERKDIITAWLKLYSEFTISCRNANGYWINTGTTVGDYT